MKSKLSFKSKRAMRDTFTAFSAWFLKTARPLWVPAVLFGMIFINGCGLYHQPGETAAQRARRHERVIRVNTSQLAEDIDKFFLLDRPTHLTDRRVP